MEDTHSSLTRLQRCGTIAIVLIVALSISGCFLLTRWQGFVAGVGYCGDQDLEHARNHLKIFSQQTAALLHNKRAQAPETVNQRLREQVDLVWKLAMGLWKNEHHRFSNAYIARQLVSMVRPLRFNDGQDYFFINTLGGTCVESPVSPQLEGRNLFNSRDGNGQYGMRALMAAANNPDGDGFSHYRWYAPGSTQLQDKVAYVRRFAPLGWMIGSSEPIYLDDADLQRRGLVLLSQLQKVGRDDFIVIDNRGVLLRFPPAPQWEGHYFIALPPGMRAAALAILEQGRVGGPLDYQIGEHRYLAFVRRLYGWNWTLATTRQLPTPDNGNMIAAGGAGTLAALLVMLAGLGASGAGCWLFMRRIRRLFGHCALDLQQSRQELKQRTRELALSRFMMDNAREMVCLMDQHARLAYENHLASTNLGETDLLRHRRLAALFENREGALPQTYQIAWPGDESRLFEVTQSTIEFGGECFRHISAREVTAHVAANSALQLAARVFETSTEAIMIADSQNRIQTVNQAFIDSTGYSEQELVGNPPSLLASGRHSRDFYDEMWKLLIEQGKWSGEIWNRRKNGEIFPEWLNISVLTDESGKVSHYVALFTDITDRKRQEAQVRHLAEYDFLTDLPNRALINDQLQLAINEAMVDGSEVAVLFIDLDHFKIVNDTLGHTQGDALLKEVARRLMQTLREGDSVGRTGGDEFVLLLPRMRKHEEAAQVAERILRSLQHPFELSGHSLKISTSIGISLFPRDGNDIQSLLMCADLAMYHAKACGRNTFRFYSSQMNEQINERLQLESRLREALNSDQLFLLYQPLFSMDGQTLIGCEALLRWHQPELGFIAPSRFLPIAEETGLIEALTEMVLDRTCRQIAEWIRHGIPLQTVSVNISSSQWIHPVLIDHIDATLTRYRLPGELLELDMSEDALMANPTQAIATLNRLRALGVRVAIDNFGMGLSSPAHLKHFAPSKLKIDRSFVADLPDNSEHAAIVSAIIHLADALDIASLAKGVETEAQRAALQRMGCQCFQGFLAGAPQSADGMGEWLRHAAICDT